MKSDLKKIVLSFVVLLAAGISPNLFVAAQAGYASMSNLAVYFLIPSIIILGIIYGLSIRGELKEISFQIRNGIIAGLIGTIGLEIIRETGFHLGGMPGEMPKLLGVLLLDRFALGPNFLSNVAGYSYHFWNGAAFGIIYSILLGRGNIVLGILYGILVGIGFMVSPAAVALGVGYFGLDFGWGFPLTVTLAHISFGSLLGWIIFRINKNSLSLFNRFTSIYSKRK
ncbi:MAG: hypothetical protein KAS58_04780 [Calditrichia bacterium]|nr:hypothetical protein [Calditrichia bacterium]